MTRGGVELSTDIVFLKKKKHLQYLNICTVLVYFPVTVIPVLKQEELSLVICVQN